MKMKKIKVNQDACIGCGACVAIDPDHLAFNDEGLSHPISNDNLDSTDLNSAIDSCPTSAISLTESNENDEEQETECECGCEDCHCTEEDNCGCHCFEEE